MLGEEETYAKTKISLDNGIVSSYCIDVTQYSLETPVGSIYHLYYMQQYKTSYIVQLIYRVNHILWGAEMKKIINNNRKGTWILYFVGYSCFYGFFLYEPGFIHGNPAVTRLWWELVPLIVTVIVTLIFEKRNWEGQSPYIINWTTF